MDVTTPELQAYRYTHSRGASLVAWCVHCLQWHWHGAGDGHRVAHCHDPQSPYNTGGYELHEVGTITEREMKQQARLNKRRGRT